MSNLTNNTTKLQNILDMVDALPNDTDDNFIIHEYKVFLEIYNKGESKMIEFSDAIPNGHTFYSLSFDVENSAIKVWGTPMTIGTDTVSISVFASIVDEYLSDDSPYVNVYFLYLNTNSDSPTVNYIGSAG